MKKVLMGNHAAAMGAVLARVQVASAYPITPQTQVVEYLAELKASGVFQGQYLKVESEHSAMAELLGAATAGARCFTASSSQGLAYMHEVLHWVAGARLPVVMADVNRALAAPWNLWTDQTDSLSQRDTGWLQLYCASNQEVLDTVLMAYKIAEKVLLPVMVVYDGFTLSHTYEPVDVPAQDDVDKFLPAYRPKQTLDCAAPISFGALANPKEYFRLRRRMDADMHLALNVINEVGQEFAEAFGRSYGLVEAYRCEDAETILVTSGAVGSTAMAAVDELRGEGKRAGALRVRAFRPFPAEAIASFARPGTTFAVVDRNYSPGSTGIFCSEIKASLYGTGVNVPVHGTIAGLGGGDITPELLKEIWHGAGSVQSSSEPAWVEDAR